ncbi:MAG: stage V sporulation protein AB [Roseburia sp.]|nr:stage V sporulation protein AB [Roseburia sp.]
MWSNHLILAAMGLVSGAATAAGTFAFVIIIGVVPRLIGKCHRAAGTMYFENAIILGAIIGCVWSVFPMVSVPFGRPMLMIYGLSAGIFVGCIAIALAEILNTFPIIFRRFHIKKGLFWVILSLAIGKMCGSFYYFLVP